MKLHIFASVTAIVTLLTFGVAYAAEELPVEVEPIIQVIEQPTKPPQYSPSFTDHLKAVFNIGSEIGNPETLQAILMQETNGGRSERVGNKGSPVGKRSYGLMQVQVVAARSIFMRYPEVFAMYFPDRKYSSVVDEEIISLLLADDEANIRIAAYHFNLYLQLSKGDWHRAVAAWNVGIGGVNKLQNYAEYSYVLGIKRKLETVVRPFNRSNGLQLTQRNQKQ